MCEYMTSQCILSRENFLTYCEYKISSPFANGKYLIFKIKTYSDSSHLNTYLMSRCIRYNRRYNIKS